MFVPFISERKSLYKRKGGGGGGHGGGGGGKSGGGKSSSSSKSSSKSSSSSSKSTSKSITSKTKFGSSSRTTSSYGSPAIIPAAAIPAGQLFAGRLQGGAGRTQIFGTRTYGSGYPGLPSRGTAGRGFPFFYWPLAWPLAIGAGIGVGSSTLYLHNRGEYGDPTNSSRPGGPQAFIVLPSTLKNASNTNLPQSTFRVMSDSETVSELLSILVSNCTGYHLDTGSAYYTSTPLPYSTNSTSLPRSSTATPQPEDGIQYFRASSILLTLDGYNNTLATYPPENATDTNIPDAPFPSGVDLVLMDCLNQTIGLGAPLVSSSMGDVVPQIPTIGLFGLVWVLGVLLGGFV